MATILREKYIFGPIISRRLGRSLGVNILPVNFKICNFNCIYCECGWNDFSNQNNNKLPTREIIKLELESKLKELKKLGETFDTITFSGNGEPTLHPRFLEIIADTLELRKQYFPKVKISVLTNATNLDDAKIITALKQIDNPILKLDSGYIETLEKINKPTQKNITIDKIISNMQKFNGGFIMQIMFLRNSDNTINNTTDDELNKLIDIMHKTSPRQIMIYTIARDTPDENLIKLTQAELEILSNKIKEHGFNVMATV